jgi:hypothetical protein
MQRSILLLLASRIALPVAGCNQRAERAASDPSIAAVADPLDFPTRGFRLERVALAGWRQNQDEKGKTVVQWISPDSQPGNLRGLVTVEAARGTEPTARAAARGLASDWGGKVAADKVVLDGEPAFKVVATNKTPALNPVLGIVAMHGGYLYLIMGGVRAGGECQKEVEELINGWRWQNLVRPSEHLGFLPQPVAALGGLITINYPKDMHRYGAEHPDSTLDVGLYDIQLGGSSFEALIQRAPSPPGGIAAVKDPFLKTFNQKKMCDTALTWHERNGDSTRLVTASLHSSIASKETKGNSFLKWALIQLDREHLVVINFTIGAKDENENTRFDAAADAIVDSIELAGTNKLGLSKH